MRKRVVVILIACILFVLTVTPAAYGSNHYERRIILFGNSIKPETQIALINKYGSYVQLTSLVFRGLRQWVNLMPMENFCLTQ